MKTKELGTTYKMKKVLCAFTPGRPRPICPKCYSRPSIDLMRAKLSGVVIVGEILVDGQPKGITENVYCCSNPACNLAIVVHGCLSLKPMYLMDQVLAYQLEGTEADRFELGHHNAAGVWLPYAKPAEVIREEQRQQERLENAAKQPDPTQPAPKKRRARKVVAPVEEAPVEAPKPKRAAKETKGTKTGRVKSTPNKSNTPKEKPAAKTPKKKTAKPAAKKRTAKKAGR